MALLLSSSILNTGTHWLTARPKVLQRDRQKDSGLHGAGR